MPDQRPRLLVTAATGQLGRLVVESLLQTVPASRIVATARSAEAGAALTALGIEVRIADYDLPQTLQPAFAGIGRLLLISSSKLDGGRAAQHRNAINAAKSAGVGQIVYTSLLHASTTPLGLAADHVETEAMLRDSGVPHVVLRNGWYTENSLASIPAALQYNALLGSAGDGRFSSAARADFAAAAAAVLTAPDDLSGRVYELAGDTSFTLSEFAAEIARQSGKTVVFKNLPKADFKGVLLGAGLPEPLAELLADSDEGAAAGGLFDDSHQLSALIGRPTTPLAVSVAKALQGG